MSGKATEQRAAQAPATVRVSLAPESSLVEWIDPQTHLVVTREAREVPVEQIGEAARRERDVRIEEV